MMVGAWGMVESFRGELGQRGWKEDFLTKDAGRVSILRLCFNFWKGLWRGANKNQQNLGNIY